MRIVNETRTVPLTTRGAVTVEGRVRVRGVDARADGRGFVYERHAPIDVTLREAGTSRVQALPRDGMIRRVIPLIMAPLLAVLARRLFSSKG